ncbi:MAG TPA: thioredoxin [Thermodesulfobacteriota bacterium]|nr:thioredoxin [Thermodesulfobacteriota bacterium]
MTNEAVTAVTDDTFETEVLNSPLPTVVDFWAAWCGPCRAIAPVVEDLARQYAGRVKVVKLNVDENPRTPSRYGVLGIPTLILFKNGQPVDQLVGALPRPRLEALFSRAA